MVLYASVLQFYEKKRAKEKKEQDSFLSKKIGGNTKQCQINDICRRKGAAFSVKLKLQRESFE